MQASDKSTNCARPVAPVALGVPMRPAPNNIPIAPVALGVPVRPAPNNIPIALINNVVVGRPNIPSRSL